MKIYTYILSYLYQEYNEPKEFIQHTCQFDNFEDLALILDQINKDELEWANELIVKSSIEITTITKHYGTK